MLTAHSWPCVALLHFLTAASSPSSLDVGCSQHLGQQGGGHEGGVAHHHKRALVLIGHLAGRQKGPLVLQIAPIHTYGGRQGYAAACCRLSTRPVSARRVQLHLIIPTRTAPAARPGTCAPAAEVCRGSVKSVSPTHFACVPTPRAERTGVNDVGAPMMKHVHDKT